MKGQEPNYRRNYRIFIEIANGAAFSDLAGFFGISAARVDQIFQSTLKKICDDDGFTFQKANDLSISGTVRTNAYRWCDDAIKSYKKRTGKDYQ